MDADGGGGLGEGAPRADEEGAPCQAALDLECGGLGGSAPGVPRVAIEDGMGGGTPRSRGASTRTGGGLGGGASASPGY
uniref:Uncharacterized protein n=1 Tax=Arundo donax TaxID=35708 RepID=A0A0A9BQN0_ARUDO